MQDLLNILSRGNPKGNLRAPCDLDRAEAALKFHMMIECGIALEPSRRSNTDVRSDTDDAS